mmetsp:Transcript_134503/g.287765  ORF Transcript_134503/g.287765 Transcript_134503/m.287765 type:complete len:237 (-) Transcript_134503:20-730(-)
MKWRHTLALERFLVIFFALMPGVVPLVTGGELTGHARAAPPEPLTEEECLACESNVTELHSVKRQCAALVDMLQDVSGNLTTGFRARQSQAETQLRSLRAQALARQRELATLRDRLRTSQEALSREVGGLMSLWQAERGVERSVGDNLLGRWLRCEASRTSAQLAVEVCYRRIRSEQTRLADREQQYELAAQGREGDVKSMAAETEILRRAALQAGSEHAHLEARAKQLRVRAASL